MSVSSVHLSCAFERCSEKTKNALRRAIPRVFRASLSVTAYAVTFTGDEQKKESHMGI